MFLPHHLVAAVRAHVVEGVDVVVEAARDDDRRQSARQFAGEEGALLRQPLGAPDAQPVLLEHGLALGGEELLGDRVLVVHRAGAEVGVVGGVLAPPGGEFLLDSRHGVTPSSSRCPLAASVGPGLLVPRRVERFHLAAEREERALRVRLAAEAVAELVEERALERVGEQLTGVAQRQRRPLDQFAGVLPGPVEQLVLGQHLVDHAPLLGLLGAELLARQQEVARAVVPGEDAPDDVLAVAGHLAAREVRRVLEVGVLGGQHDVAHERHLGVHVARAVDRADHRHVDVEHVEDEMRAYQAFSSSLCSPRAPGMAWYMGCSGGSPLGSRPQLAL